MQLATAAIGVPLGRPNGINDTNYVYDIAHRSGLFFGTIKIDNIEHPIADDKMGDVAVCPVSTGALVETASGGDIFGTDMYGQWIEDFCNAGFPTKIAFATVTSAPADATWVNQYGLPYKYKEDHSTPVAAVTIVPPASDEDARGTFYVTGGVVGPVEQAVHYIVDQNQTFGAPYKDRFVSAAFNARSIVINGSISPTGAVEISIPSPVTGGDVPCEIKWGDGQREVALSGNDVTHQMSPLWMSQYADQIRTPSQMNNVVTVDPLGNDLAPIYVTFIGLPNAFVSVNPRPTPYVDPVSNWSAMRTHADIDEASADIDKPDDWSSMSLTDKRKWLNENAG